MIAVALTAWHAVDPSHGPGVDRLDPRAWRVPAGRLAAVSAAACRRAYEAFPVLPQCVLALPMRPALDLADRGVRLPGTVVLRGPRIVDVLWTALASPSGRWDPSWARAIWSSSASLCPPLPSERAALPLVVAWCALARQARDQTSEADTIAAIAARTTLFA
jgi:hypothetical protein